MGPGELLLVLILALIFFGPSKLPEIARSLGRGIREFQKATSQITEELSRELQTDTPVQQTPPLQAPLAQEAPRDDPPATAVAQSEPLVLEIKPPATNGAATSHDEVPPTVQTAPMEPSISEAPAVEVAAKPRRTWKPRKPAAEVATKPRRTWKPRKPTVAPAIGTDFAAADAEAAAIVTEPAAETVSSIDTAPSIETAPSVDIAPLTKPRRRRKAEQVAEATLAAESAQGAETAQAVEITQG